MEHKNVPTIRFKGFQNEWQNNFLYKLCDISTGYPFDSKLFSNDGQYLVITNSNIQNESRNVDNKVGSKINLLNPTFNNFILNIGDILITMDGTVGRSAIVSKTHNILAQRVGRLSNTNNFNYLYYLLNNGKFHYEMTKLAKGGTIKHISLSDIGKFNTFSSDKDEQTQIGNFFKTFDEQISLQEQKHQKLINLKKAMLEKMFPKEGADVPEIRFKGFTEKWEVKKLGDFGNVAMNKRIFKSETSIKGEIPFYKIGTFGSIPDSYITRKKYLEYKSKYPYPQIGDILISASGSIGRLVIYQGKEEYFQDSNIVWLKHEGRLNNTFLKQFYLIVKWNGLEGSTIKRLYNSNILSTKILVPSLEEQKKIGDYFENLDHLIQQSQTQLDKFKNIKQALLQKMFV